MRRDDTPWPHDWRDRPTEGLRGPRERERADFGQADYSQDYRYDPRARVGYRSEEDRYWDEGRPESHRSVRTRRSGPSDRVLWAVIMEQLDDERRLDLTDVEVDVRDAEVTLNGYVRRKADKRRIEDIADIAGVENVQNNLRVRGRDRSWTFI